MLDRFGYLRTALSVVLFAVVAIWAGVGGLCGVLQIQNHGYYQPRDSPDVREFSKARTKEQIEGRLREREVKRRGGDAALYEALELRRLTP